MESLVIGTYDGASGSKFMYLKSLSKQIGGWLSMSHYEEESISSKIVESISRVLFSNWLHFNWRLDCTKTRSFNCFFQMVFVLHVYVFKDKPIILILESTTSLLKIQLQKIAIKGIGY